jgi:uncharacterized protein involved in outer membrane biogenesis
MRRITYGLLGLLGILLGTALIVPFFLNINDYKPQILAKAKETLGRDVTIDGKISLHLLPMPQLTLKQIGVSNLPGGSPQDLIRIQNLTVSIELFPLLRKQLKIRTVSLDQPEIFLEKLPNGQPNWTFTPASSAVTALSTSDSSSPSNFEVAVDKVVIQNGRIVYHEKGKDIEIQEINTTSKLESVQGPYAMAGTFKCFGQNVKIDTKMGHLGDAQDVLLNVQIDESTSTLVGKVSLSPLLFKGNIKATIDSKIFNKGKSSPAGSRLLRLDGALKADSQNILISSAKFEIGAAHPTGDISIALKDTIQIQGSLKSLPGNGECTFTLSPFGKALSGSINGSVAQAKNLLNWLEIDAKSVPPELLGPLKVSTNFSIADSINLNKLDLTIHDAKLRGDVSWGAQKSIPSLGVNLESPKIENVLKLLGLKNPKSLGIGKLKGNIEWDKTSLNITHLQGQLGPNFSFAGDVAVDHGGAKPIIKAVLSLNSINVSTLMASRQMANPHYPEAKVFLVSTKSLPADSRWSHAPLDFSFLNKFDGQFDLNASRLTHSDIVISHPKLKASVQNGRLDITSLTGSIFEGSLVGHGHLTAKNSLHLHTTLTNANMKHLSSHGTNVKIVGGSLSLSSDFTSHGNSVNAMIHNLEGPLNISAKDGLINGFDLHALSERLGSLRNPHSLLGLLNTTMMGQGQTRFSSFKGDIIFKRGIGTIQSMNLIAPDGQGHATGQIDLPRYLLNIQADFHLTQHPHLPPFHLKLSGPLDNPSRKLDTNALQKYMMENVFKGVIEKLGKDKLNAGDVLGSLLGGGKASNRDEKPAQPQKENKPEQIVKDIFKGIF